MLLFSCFSSFSFEAATTDLAAAYSQIVSDLPTLEPIATDTPSPTPADTTEPAMVTELFVGTTIDDVYATHVSAMQGDKIFF